MGASPSREGDSREQERADGARHVDRQGQERRGRYRHDRHGHERNRVDQRQRRCTRDDKRLDEEWLAKKRARCEELALAAVSDETLDSDSDEDQIAELHVDEPTVVASVPSAVSSSERSDSDVHCKNQPRSDRSRTKRVSNEHDEKRSDRVHARTRGQLESGRHNDRHRKEREDRPRERSPIRRKRHQLDRNDSGDDEMRRDQEWLAKKRAERKKLALVSSGAGTLEITPIYSEFSEPQCEPSDDAQTHSAAEEDCPGSPTYGSARARIDETSDYERIDHNHNYRKRKMSHERKGWNHSNGRTRTDRKRSFNRSRSSYRDNCIRPDRTATDKKEKSHTGGGAAPVTDGTRLTGGSDYVAPDLPEWFSSMRDRDRRRKNRKKRIRRSRARGTNKNADIKQPPTSNLQKMRELLPGFVSETSEVRK